MAIVTRLKCQHSTCLIVLFTLRRINEVIYEMYGIMYMGLKINNKKLVSI